MTEIYYGKESNGPKRKYYRITKYGKIYFNALVDDWEKLNEIIRTIGVKKQLLDPNNKVALNEVMGWDSENPTPTKIIACFPMIQIIL